MRKLTVTTFAVIYALMVLQGSAVRSMSWATREAATLAEHTPLHSSHAFHKPEHSESHLAQTKLSETEFVVECLKQGDETPVLASGDTIRRIDKTPHWRSSSPVSSRAPPSLA